jgi:thioredoxin
MKTQPQLTRTKDYNLMDIKRINKSPLSSAFLCSLLIGLFVSPVFSVERDSATKKQKSPRVAKAAYSVTPPRVEVVTSKTFDKQVMKSTGPVLVDFYADWCGPCRTQSKILNGFIPKLRGAKIVKVNVDDNASLAQQFGVTALPTLILVQDGKVVGKQVGIVSETQLRTVFASYLVKDGN